MSITCYIIDQEPQEASPVIEYVEQNNELIQLGYECDPRIALTRILSGEIRPDVCFLAIGMAEIDGIEIARTIKHLCCVVFTTKFSDYVSEAYELDATDYLLKPVRYLRFMKCIEKVKRSLALSKFEQMVEVGYFFVKDVTKYTIVRVITAELQLIEGCGNFVKLHLINDAQPVMTNLSMIKIMTQIGSTHFVQVHKSYIINLAHIVHLTGNEITLTNGRKVNVGKKFKGHFINRIQGLIY